MVAKSLAIFFQGESTVRMASKETEGALISGLCFAQSQIPGLAQTRQFSQFSIRSAELYPLLQTGVPGQKGRGVQVPREALA